MATQSVGRKTKLIPKDSFEPRPPTRRLFTVDEYMKMDEIGIFVEGEHVELMDGEIIQLSPRSPAHSANTSRFLHLLAPLFVGGKMTMRVHGHFLIDEYTHPEPDVALLRWRKDSYRHRWPGPEDVLLVVEISDTSLSYDRGRKLARYAEADVPEVWIENIPDSQIEAHRNPVNSEYTESRIYRPGETISPSAFPDLELPVSQLIGVEPEQG